MKKIETRSWSTTYRGTLCIHAGMGLGSVGGKRGLLALLETEPFWSVLRTALYVPNVGYPGDAETIANEFDYGAIVAVCRLFDCYPTCGDGYYRDPDRRVITRVTDQERAFGDYSPSRYAWLLSDIRALPEPISAKGALSLWEWDGKL